MKALYCIVFCFFAISISAQDEVPEAAMEESAELFLEEYSDDFQEKFFEALKQKAIENYDRAANYLLECKQMQPDNSVVYYELAKAYFADRQYTQAENYAIQAVNMAPNNLWYLTSLVTILQKQGNSVQAIKKQLPFSDAKLQENLGLIYFKQRKYYQALAILEPLDASEFKDDLELKIKDVLDDKPKATVKSVVSKPANPLQNIKNELDALEKVNDFKGLLAESTSALEAYPAQPHFYYMNGLALLKNGAAKNAIEVLESGLDFMIDDVALANKFYAQLAEAYTVLGNTTKAQNYLSKIKP